MKTNNNEIISSALTCILVCFFFITFSFILPSYGQLQETERVSSKSGKVEKNDDIDFDDADETIGSIIRGGPDFYVLFSPNYLPPKGKKFKEFEGAGTHVDIELDPGAFDPRRIRDSENQIQIRSQVVLSGAAHFPLKGEGNLKGGEGKGKGEIPHWSSKVQRKGVFTVFINQPGNGGDRDIWLGADAGHAFVQIRDCKDETVTKGKYGGGKVSDIKITPKVTRGPGLIKDDDPATADVKNSWVIPCDVASEMKEILESVSADTYDLETDNCSDFSIMIGDMVNNKVPNKEIEIPDSEVDTWYYDGSAPGPQGEDVMEKYETAERVGGN